MCGFNRKMDESNLLAYRGLEGLALNPAALDGFAIRIGHSPHPIHYTVKKVSDVCASIGPGHRAITVGAIRSIGNVSPCPLIHSSIRPPNCPVASPESVIPLAVFNSTIGVNHSSAGGVGVSQTPFAFYLGPVGLRENSPPVWHVAKDVSRVGRAVWQGKNSHTPHNRGFGVLARW